MTGQRIDRKGCPSQVVGEDDRRACKDQPTWQWFALPFARHGAEATFSDDRDTDARKRGHNRALVVCASCPLALRCVQASWTTEEYGVYGAVSEVERFYLGGRGRSTSAPRSYARYQKALGRVAKRFGSEQHPVVRWIVAQGLPRGIVAPEVEVEEQGAA